MTAQSAVTVERFSLVRGGSFFELQRRLLGLPTDAALATVRRGLILAAIAWLPMVVLATVQGVAIGTEGRVGLLEDIGAWARFVIAIPLLVIAEGPIEHRLPIAIDHLRTANLVPERRRPDLERALARLEHGRDSWLAEAVMLGVALVGTWLALKHVAAVQVRDWATLAGSRGLSLAALWGLFVSLPLVQFLSLRWLWRLFLWIRFMSRVSRLDLEVSPAHPDGNGGLAFFGEAQSGLFLLVSPFSVILAARASMGVLHGGESLTDLKAVVAAFVVLAAIVFLGPLLTFSPLLLRARRRGLLEYGLLGTAYARGFDRKWSTPTASEDPSLLGSSDIQSLADLGNSYKIVEGMTMVPLKRHHLIAFAIAVAAPMLPILALVVPMEEVLKKLIGILTGSA